MLPKITYRQGIKLDTRDVGELHTRLLQCYKPNVQGLEYARIASTLSQFSDYDRLFDAATKAGFSIYAPPKP